MSKTLVSVLEIGAIVGLQFIPGVGQAVAGVLGSIGIGGVTAAQGLTIASVTLAGAEAGLTSVLASSPKPATSETSIKTPLPPRVSAYGSVRLQGAYILFDTSPTGWACDCWVYHDGQIDGLIDTYLGDPKVTRLSRAGAGFGWVEHQENGLFGKDDDCIQIEVNLGLPTETAFASLLFQIPDHWTADHRGDGCVTASMISRPVKAKDFATVYATGGPDRTPVSLAMRAQLVFDWRDPAQSVTDPMTWKWSENFWLHIAHYLLVRMDKTWALHFAPTLDLWTAAADDADSRIPLRAVQTILAGPSDSGSTSLNVYSTNGLSVGMSVSIYVSGDNTMTEERTVTSVGEHSIGFSGGLTYDHPQGAQVTWLSDPDNPATEARYRGCVTHAHTDAHKGVLANLLMCGDGWLAPRSDGALVPYSGKYVAPSPDDEIGPDLITDYTIQRGVNEEDAVNTLKVTYVSANHDFNTVDTDDWVDEDDVNRRGKQLSDSLGAQMPSYSQGRRLAKRKISKVMAPFRGTVTTTAGGRKILGKRFIWLRIAEAGTTFYDAPAEITKVVRNLGTGGVTFDWIAADPNIDAWNPATEEGSPAPVGNRVAPQPIAAPTITGAVADFAAVSDDGTGVRITITAAGLNREDVTWFARWRVVGGATWNEASYTDIDAGPSVTIETGFVPTGQTIEVEAAYQTGDGRLSDYSSPAFEVDTSTDATAPDSATAITVVSWVDALNLSTDTIPRASSYRWRFYADDGTTLIRDVTTPSRTVSYTASQAAVDGVRRAYVVTVAGVNSAGAGTEVSSGVITNDPPSLVTGFSATGGTSNAEIDFDLLAEGDVAGYAIYVASVADFDPVTQGQVFRSLGSPAYLQNLAAGTFYVKMAAFDAWSDFPGLLNITAEDSFVISAGGGGTGGGGGGGGGGYCVTADTPVLMADGSTKPAGDLVVGDMLRTQHEHTMEWGNFPVEAIEIVHSNDVWQADIGPVGLRATGEHRVYMSGWLHMRDIGAKVDGADVAKITVTDAHTYVSAGVLSHNIKGRL